MNTQTNKTLMALFLASALTLGACGSAGDDGAVDTTESSFERGDDAEGEFASTVTAQDRGDDGAMARAARSGAGGGKGHRTLRGSR